MTGLSAALWQRASAALRHWHEGRSSRELWLLAAIILLAAALRIAWVAYAARDPQGFHDPTFYYVYAGQIADGAGYRLLDGSPSAYYPVGYPATIGAVFAFVTHTPIPDNLTLTNGYFQAFLGVATVWLVYEVARRLFGAGVGLVAALWIAVFPNLIYHTATFLTETLFNLVVMAALAVLFWSGWHERRLGWARLAVFGALLGYSALVRPISLPFVLLLPVAWLVAGFGWQRALAYTGVVAAATAAVILPWTVRNAIVMDAPVLISTNLGDNLCIGHYEGARGAFALPDACFNDAPYVGLDHPDFEVQRDRDNREHAVEFALDNPRAELKLLSRKSYYTWHHDHDGLWAVESYHEDPFIGSRSSLRVVPVDIPEEQVALVAAELAAITGLDGNDVSAAIDAGRASVEPSAPVLLMEDLDIEIANDVRDAKLPGVQLVVPRALQRQALERIADIFFFTTISLGGLGLIGFVLRPLEPRRLFFLLALLALAGAPLPFFGDARFHVPVLPLLAVSAAWTVLAARSLPGLIAQAAASAAVEVAEGEGPVAEQDALQDP